MPENGRVIKQIQEDDDESYLPLLVETEEEFTEESED